ncbi:hypothetical protein ElyMa_006349000 [Elysia marginata]|uniref:Uncharacterized protein n=1 Tax=Elysia marginata TaxID=1093978 RepID=A0AAV4HKK0_9GAST|nr:hypothetical protein ElyMa_006349000 [Elysia marginata]
MLGSEGRLAFPERCMLGYNGTLLEDARAHTGNTTHNTQQTPYQEKGRQCMINECNVLKTRNCDDDGGDDDGGDDDGGDDDDDGDGEDDEDDDDDDEGGGGGDDDDDHYGDDDDDDHDDDDDVVVKFVRAYILSN